MATLSGDIAIEVPQSPSWAVRGHVSPDIMSGDKTVHAVPVPINSNIENGGLIGLYGDNDWFDRLHAIPSQIDVGTIRTAHADEFRLYNASHEPALITNVVAQGGAGIEIGHPNTPFQLEAGRSALYDINVLLDGAPPINARFQFQADTTALLIITGQRLVSQIWTIPPDWTQPVVEQWQWLTDLQRARSGIEHRRSVYPSPRRGVRFRIVTDNIGEADKLLSGWQSRLFNVPRWQDRTRLLEPAEAEDTELFLDTTIGEWRPGSQFVLLGEGIAEAPVIEAVNPGSIITANPIEHEWPAGTAVYPARLMRLPQTIEFDRPAAGIFIGEAEFLADQDTGTTYTPAEIGSITFDDLPVYLHEPNRVTNAPAGYARAGVRIDAPGGIMLVDDPTGDPINSREWQINWWTRDECDTFIAWLFARAGRLNAFWFPTWSDDLKMAGVIGVNENVLRVESVDWELYYAGRNNRDVIALQERSGTWRFARVLSSEMLDGIEFLQLDRNLITAAPILQPGDVRRVCWLEKVRLDIDSIEVAWTTDEAIRVALPLRGVKQ